LNTPDRYSADELLDFATALLLRSGLTKNRAEIVAEILLEGDLLGHSTHGLQLLAPYLKELDDGRMPLSGEPAVVADHPGAVTWDGRYLPGPWLIVKAMELAFERIAAQPIVTVVIRRSNHIGCLAAYLKRATDRGLMMLLSCSDASVRSVAPHGAKAGVYTPNPLAAGFPTDGEPILIDISASATTNGMVARMNRTGTEARLPGMWLVDNQGNASDDPAVMAIDPPGAILPLGGVDSGHKGFALGLLVEALTSALGGFGRADGVTQWGASVFLQIIDPGAFAGLAAFKRETGWLAKACRDAPVKDGNPPVRLPGARALALRAKQLAEGVALHPEILPSLKAYAEKHQMPLPAAH
jgi:L-lactate dehydrogenase